jgi:hypothetical protein
MHTILSIVYSRISDDYFEQIDYFLTVRCNGCGTLSFSHETTGDGYETVDRRGRPCRQREKRHYPNPAVTPEPDIFVDPLRIAALEKASPQDYDLRKLIQLLLELNRAYASNSYLSCIFLVRAIIDHVPPIFNQANFNGVANNYNGGSSFKQVAGRLQESSKKIADMYIHGQIKKGETLPNRQSVEFKAELDALISEILRNCSTRPHS